MKLLEIKDHATGPTSDEHQRAQNGPQYLGFRSHLFNECLIYNPHCVWWAPPDKANRGGACTLRALLSVHAKVTHTPAAPLHG